MTIPGVIIPSDSDERENVTAVSILAFNGDERLIDGTQKGKELPLFIRQEVQVRASVRRKCPKKSVAVDSYVLRRGGR